MKRLKTLLGYLALAAVVLAVPAGSYFHIFDNYELDSLDLRFALRPPQKATDEVVIVEIGDDTIEYLGRFPFDRDYHAVLVKALTDFGAKAVVFDIFFSEASPGDKEFEEALKAAGNVYLPNVFELEPGRHAVPRSTGYLGKCLEPFETYARGTGHINIVPDMDGKYRRIPPYIEYRGTYVPQLSLAVACDRLGLKPEDIDLAPGRYLRLGKDIRIPLDAGSSMIINYSGKWGKAYRHYSYVDILQSYFAKSSGQEPILDGSLFKDKVCVVGLTATGTTDVHPNPLETLYPAVGIHPETYNAIVTRRFISRVPRAVNAAILILLAAFIAFATMKLKPPRSLVVLLATVLFFNIAMAALFFAWGIWADVAYPVVIMFLVYLVLTLRRLLREWKTRLFMEHELDIAKQIQQSFLPKSLPEVPGLEAAAAMMTARRVGGDIYDFVPFDREHLGVMIGDVSGKGIPAALFMAMVAGSFKFLSTSAEPEKVLFNLNAKLVKESASNLFVTVFYTVFDMKDRTVAIASGGHLPLLYLPKGKGAEFLDVDEGAPLGLMDGAYSGRKVRFSPGDVFVYYTDGITEAMNPRGDMYGQERLVKVVEANRVLPAEALIKTIEKDVRRFEPVTIQHDDITVIVVKAL